MLFIIPLPVISLGFVVLVFLFVNKISLLFKFILRFASSCSYKIVLRKISLKWIRLFLSKENKSWFKASPYGFIKEYFKFDEE